MKYSRLLIQFFCIALLACALSSCSTLGPNDLAALPENYTQVALLLPLKGPYAKPGLAVRNGFLAGYYQDLNNGQPKARIKIYDTSKTNNIAALYAKAVADGADLVIGPLTKTNVAALINNGSVNVPTITLNYVPNTTPPRKLFEFGILPQNEATQVANKANNAGLSKAIIIAPKANWGQTISNAFIKQWENLGGKVIAQLNYQPGENLRYPIRDLLKVNQSDTRSKELEKVLNEKLTFVPQRRKDFDMIFLVARPSSAREILPLLRFYYAGQVPIYSISMIYKGTPDRNYYRDMDSVIFDDIPWIFNTAATKQIQENLSRLWPNTYRSYVRLYALGLDAYYLTNHLKQLPTDPSDGLAANTGKLYLGPNHWILQQYVWAQFRNGKAIKISS